MNWGHSMHSINTFELARYGTDLQRRMHDMPVGDPMSGAAYGEYLKSKALGMIIGVVASVVTMGAAAPLLASTVLATQIAGGVMMAGGVLSGVGAVTGNKKLMKIGGIMSLAGGIGGLASNALNAGGIGGAFASGSGSEAVSSMANSFMDSASSISGGILYGDRAAAAATQAGEMAVTSPVADSQAGILESSLAEPSAATGGASGGELPVTEIKANPVVEVDATGTGVGKNNLALDQTPAAQQSAANTPPPATEKPGILSKAGGFLKDNAELMKVGAGFVKDAMAAGGDAAEAATNEALAKAKVYDAQASLLTTQNDQAKFNLANQNKKSVMLSADDPQLDAKMAQAQAEGAAIGIIPVIGAGGVKQTGQTAFSASAPTGQQVVRQATFSSPTPQRAA